MADYHTQFPSRAVASCFALAAFAIAILAGIGAGRQASNILLTAIIAMFICQVVGSIASMIIEAAIREHIAKHRAAHPIPDLDISTAPSTQTAQAEQPE